MDEFYETLTGKSFEGTATIGYQTSHLSPEDKAQLNRIEGMLTVLVGSMPDETLEEGE